MAAGVTGAYAAVAFSAAATGVALLTNAHPALAPCQNDLLKKRLGSK